MNKKREDNNIYKKLNEHNSDISDLRKDISELKKKVANLSITRDTLIADDLQQSTPGFKDSYMFTYSQISERHGVPVSQIQRVARENGLERKNSKKLG